MDNETAGKLAELGALVDATLSEFREWGSSVESIVRVLDDVGGAIDAEDIPGAIEDALSNVRMLDWSSPKRMDELTETDMVRIENLLDEIHSGLENEETLPGDVGEPGDHVIIAWPGDDYDEHGATLLSIEGKMATVTLDDDTVPMQYELGHLRADPEGTAESYLRGAINAYRARNVGDAIEHAANAIRRMSRS
jgi:hypothetical protein